MKSISVLRLWLITAMLSIAYSAAAYDVKVGGIYYGLNETERTAYVTYDNSTYYNSYKGDISIPSIILYDAKEYSVTSIGYRAFYDCIGLTSVTIPNSVTSIGSEAFKNCTGLTSVEFGSSITSIGEYAFYKCTGLTSMTIPNSVTSIGSGAFQYCSELTSVSIPNSVTSIGGYAFSYCSGLNEVHISDLAAWCKFDFIYLGSNPLEYAHNLYLNGKLITDLVIPNSVTSIGGNTFTSCIGLTSVTIPNSVTSIGPGAFLGCIGLTSVTIPNSVTSIGSGAFMNTVISKITIPKTVKTIKAYAFACNEESEVYVEWENPADETLSLAQQLFSDKIMQHGKLFVPIGTKALYEQFDPWRNFFYIEEYTPSGVEEIEANSGVTIGVDGGKIVVYGAGYANVEVFNTNGAPLHSGAADSMPELAAGIYIVRVGSTAQKVAIVR